MKAGKLVTFVKGRSRSDAVIEAVTGSGPSGYKTLTLNVGGKTYKDVPHAGDDAGAGYWDAHAVPDAADDIASAPVVPEAEVKAKGRATAGVGSKQDEKT